MKVAEEQKIFRSGSYNPCKAQKNMIDRQVKYEVVQSILFFFPFKFEIMLFAFLKYQVMRWRCYRKLEILVSKMSTSKRN
jgi:hypothetical protein